MIFQYKSYLNDESNQSTKSEKNSWLIEDKSIDEDEESYYQKKKIWYKWIWFY